MFTGALYFADNGMKTPDGSFKGFPAGWNMVVFGLMVLSPSEAFTIAAVIVCCVLTFAPIRFVHPVRVKRWRLLTLPVTLIWMALAALAIWDGMVLSTWAAALFTAASLYLFSVSAVQQLIDRVD